MILKIATQREGWRFIDGLATIHVDAMTPARYAKDYGNSGKAYDSVLMDFYSEIGNKDGTEHSIQKTSEFEQPLKEITAYFKDGKSENYLTDRVVYLMSDEGKTIERIN